MMLKVMKLIKEKLRDRSTDLPVPKVALKDAGLSWCLHSLGCSVLATPDAMGCPWAVLVAGKAAGTGHAELSVAIYELHIANLAYLSYM